MKHFFANVYIAILAIIGFVIYSIWIILLIFPMSYVFIVDFWYRYSKSKINKHPTWYPQWMKKLINKIQM